MQDKATEELLEERYFKGDTVSDMNHLVPAVKWHRRKFAKAGLVKLYKSEQTFAAWRRSQPARSRLGLPNPRMSSICKAMGVRKKQRRAAGSVWLAKECYLRPGELARCRRRDLRRPVPPAAPDWSLVLHPQELGVTSKTGGLDETVVLDLEIHKPFAPQLEFLASGDPDLPLCDLGQGELAKLFTETAVGEGLEELDPVVYQCRHTWPAGDRAQMLRKPAGIKRRGRWISDASVRRDEKGGGVGEQLNRLAPSVRAAAAVAEKELAQILNRA